MEADAHEIESVGFDPNRVADFPRPRRNETNAANGTRAHAIMNSDVNIPSGLTHLQSSRKDHDRRRGSQALLLNEGGKLSSSSAIATMLIGE
jgi:hypothetical protein